MKVNLSQEEIGQRIARLRKAKGLSQDDLARNMEMSRSSLTQIELGNRNIDIMELQKLSMILGFSLDDFMSKDFDVEKVEEIENINQDIKSEIRISVPKLNTEKFKNVLLYMLERCAGKPNVGETVLYKLLYFSDFNYYELYEEHMTGAKYRKLPYGPVPLKVETIINQMIDAGLIQRIKTEYFDKTQTRYIPLERANLKELLASEKEVVDKVIEQMADWSATTISNYSHMDMPWLASKEGEDISYELAFYREAPYSVRTYEDENEDQ